MSDHDLPTPKGEGLGGFAELGSVEGDCLCPDAATLGPGCPAHDPAARRYADGGLLPRALTDPVGLAAGLPPGALTGEVRHDDPRPGAAQGRAIAEAEDRRSMRDAIEQGWPGAPETPVVVSPTGDRQTLREWVRGGDCPADWCPNDSHAASCRCQLGGPVVVDIPNATPGYLTTRQRWVQDRDTCPACRGVGGHVESCPHAGPLEQALRAAEAQEPLPLEITGLPSSTGDHARIICERAAELVNGDRNADYGDALDNFTETAALWSPILGIEVSAEQVALCMAQVKIARLIHNTPHDDSWIDGVGYLALGGGIARRRRS